MKVTIRTRSNISVSTKNVGTPDITVERTAELEPGESFNLEEHKQEIEKIQTTLLASTNNVMKEMGITPVSDSVK